jgi:hypothetical protein
MHMTMHVVCREAASVELELSAILECQRAYEAVCLSGGDQALYGALADGMGRCTFSFISVCHVIRLLWRHNGWHFLPNVKLLSYFQ